MSENQSTSTEITHISTPNGQIPISLPSPAPTFTTEPTFSFLMPLSSTDFTRNIGIPCEAHPNEYLERLESQKQQFWSGGAFLVKVANVGKAQEGNAWISPGDYVFVQLRGPFRRAVAFWDQDAIVSKVEKGELPKEEVFEPTHEDFALLNDLHVMTMHRGG